MKYLFFDIECSDGKHICSFGYVLTDINFSIIEKKDILINPEAIFHTGAWSKAKREKNEKDRGITLAYPKEEFVASPKFGHYYQEIKGLLTNEDTMVVGFSCDNDARFINWACNRYKLPFINYKLFDIQRAYREYKELTTQPSLEKAIEDLGVDISNYIQHRSDEDAEVTMLIAKCLCDSLNVSLDELFAKYPPSEGVVTNGEIKFKHVDGSVCGGGRYTGSNNTRRNHTIFYSHLCKTKPKKGADLPLKGEKVCFSTVFEDKHFAEMLLLIDMVAECGGKCVTRASDASIYVTVDSPKVCRRLKTVDQRLQKGAELRKMDIEAFLSLIGTSYDQLLAKGAEFRKSHIGKVLK